MDVDVCQAVAEEVVKERDVQKSTLLPISFCVAEHKVEGRHEEDVESHKEEERVISARPKGVSKEDKNEETADDLEENAEEKDDPVEERCEVLVQSATLEGGMVGGKAPGKTEDGGDDADGLVGLKDRQLALHAHLDQPDLNLVLGHVVNEAWQKEIELDKQTDICSQVINPW